MGGWVGGWAGGLYLLLVGSSAEDLLDITAHVERIKKLVALVEHEALDVVEFEDLLKRWVGGLY